ncbi:MAG: hypothetical protein ACW98X_17490 [Promethearchaeota archaeon]|jgi:hypothetical protein
MKVVVKTDMSYYEFLETIHQISTNSHSIQNKVMKQVCEIFDICQLKNKLDRKIEYFDGLLLSAEE